MVGDWREDIRSALRDFITVSQLAKSRVSLKEEDVEFKPAPHQRPAALPNGKAAVYGFWFDGDWLKIGRAGPNTNPHYRSQHYNGSARSTLSGSLRRDASMRGVAGLEEDDLRGWAAWIERETSRVNILLPSTSDKMLISLLEAYLHGRLHPKYEG